MSKTYLVLAEVRGGGLRQISLELIQAAKNMKDAADRIVAVLMGSGVAALADELAQYGVDQVQVVDNAALGQYNPETYASALLGVIEQVKPDAVVIGHTGAGRDLAPKVAAALSAGQISDVTYLEKSGSEIIFTRPIYAGKVFEKKRVAEGAFVVTIRPNNIPAAEAGGAKAEIVQASYNEPANLRSIVKDVVRKSSGKVDLTEAKIIVSGGRGVKSAEGFKPLEELADVLNAAVGASRGACDGGYCDYSMQIGQTGKVVTPEVYIACGISGAIQHLAGMSQSRVIIAVNKDPEAPIFKVADYGIVGDLFEVVPLLTEEFKKILV